MSVNKNVIVKFTIHDIDCFCDSSGMVYYEDSFKEVSKELLNFLIQSTLLTIDISNMSVMH
jgi:hypothetical protein